jgi:transposase
MRMSRLYVGVDRVRAQFERWPMMGTKARRFRLAPTVTLEELASADHIYHHLDRVLDFCFVRDLVKDCYASGIGRPSVNPVAFFRLSLVMSFASLRSEVNCCIWWPTS